MTPLRCSCIVAEPFEVALLRNIGKVVIMQ
jgi:hypothetical protein